MPDICTGTTATTYDKCDSHRRCYGEVWSTVRNIYYHESLACQIERFSSIYSIPWIRGYDNNQTKTSFVGRFGHTMRGFSRKSRLYTMPPFVADSSV